MKTLFLCVALGAGFLLSAGASADAPPAGAIAQCKDGTYFSGTSHSGACKGHQGVKEWLDKDKAAAAPAPKASASKSSASTADADSTASKKSKSKSKKTADATSTASDKGKTSKTAKSTTAAAAPAASAGPIAKCKDGTTFNGTSHKGACRGHKGVAEWLDSPASAATPATKAAPAATPAATAAPAPATKAAPATTAAPAPKAAPATTPAPESSESKRTPPTPASQITQKAGGGPGLVWVNADSKVYHCQGDEWYGKTKEGSYMSEAAAKTGGNRAARGKECGG